jgi:two-component system sensor histidine kinase UhpB
MIKALPIILAVSLACTFAHKLGWLDRLADPPLDFFLRLCPLAPKHTFVVAIEESDYQNMFHGKLTAPMVQKVIMAIADGHPRAIVVDLDTSASEFSSLQNMRLETPIFYAAAPAIVSAAGQNEVKFCALGEPVEDLPRDMLTRTGLVALREDQDGVVRRYFREVGTRIGERHVEFSSLPWATLTGCKFPVRDPEDKTKETMFRFIKPSRPVHRLIYSDNYTEQSVDLRPSATIDAEYNCDIMMKLHTTPGWHQLLGGTEPKIVVLGGTYHAPTDTYITPVGHLPGVLIIASIIESELQQSVILKPGELALFIVELCFGLLLAFINCRFSSVSSVVPFLSCVGLMAALAVCSWMSFSSFSFWFDFIPVLVVVQGYYFYEHIREFRKRTNDLLQTQLKLVNAVETGTEQERRRVAEELHDATGSIFREIADVVEKVIEQPNNAQTHGARATKLIKEAQKVTRDITQDLYPAQFESFSMLDNLDRLAKRVETFGLDISIEDNSGSLVEQIPKGDRLPVYRIVQEAFANILKHAGAKSARLTICKEGKSLVLVVSDDGTGLGKGRDDSRGMETMRSRATLLGGTVRITSPSKILENGTDVELVLPANKPSPTII